MESLKQDVFLQFNENQLESVRKNYNYDVNKLVQDIDLFEDWIAKQNHFRLRNFDREYLEKYLIYNKGSIERAKKHFDNLCTYRNLMPEFLQNFNIHQFEGLRASSKLVFMPTPTPDNYRVAISSIYANHDKMDIALYYKYVIMGLEYTTLHDYCNGWIVILDTRDMPYSMLAKMNPIVIGKAISLITETMGQRVKSFDFISGSKFIDTVVNIFKQSISAKLGKRITVHDSLESLKNSVGKDSLPSDYGGTGNKTLAELDEDFFKLLTSDEHLARMKFLESATTDETCRLSSKIGGGTAGSFKTLAID